MHSVANIKKDNAQRFPPSKFIIRNSAVRFFNLNTFEALNLEPGTFIVWYKIHRESSFYGFWRFFPGRLWFRR